MDNALYLGLIRTWEVGLMTASWGFLWLVMGAYRGHYKVDLVSQLIIQVGVLTTVVAGHSFFMVVLASSGGIRSRPGFDLVPGLVYTWVPCRWAGEAPTPGPKSVMALREPCGRKMCVE